MSFESGSIRFRVFYMSGKMSATPEKDFAKDAAPPITTMGCNEISGWVSGRHMLDRQITEENAYYGGYLRLTLMKAERKVPESLLRAECQIEELALMQSKGWDYVKRETRSEIKKEVTSRLLPDMPPSLTGIHLIYDPTSDLVFASAMSDKQVDALVINFQKTTGISLIQMNPATAARKLKSIDTDMLEPTSFSPELEDPLAGKAIGQDFLTWLWFHSEIRQGELRVEGTPYAVMIEGPLTFFLEGDGAHEIVMKNGVPEISTEAKTCLLSGKKLLQAKVTIGGEHEAWTTTLTADDFAFKSLKIPKSANVDAISRFQQRMISMNRFLKVFIGYYDQFLTERLDASTWRSTQKAIHKWVTERQAKR